jgi:hypothetical protein
MSPQCAKLLKVFKQNRGKYLSRLDLYKLTGIFNIPGRVYELRGYGADIKSDFIYINRLKKVIPVYQYLG